jgi:hypothetical protein
VRAPRITAGFRPHHDGAAYAGQSVHGYARSKRVRARGRRRSGGHGGNSPRWSHKGDELFYLDAQSNLVAARVTTTPSFAVHGTRVLFNASDFIQTAVSRRNYDVSADDQRFLMV